MSSTVPSRPLSSIRGLSSQDRARFESAGIHDTADLLAAAPTVTQERALAKKTGVSTDVVREAVNRADLLRVKGVGGVTADLFENVGVESARELAQRNASNLAETVRAYAHAHSDQYPVAPAASRVAQAVLEAKSVVGTPKVTLASMGPEAVNQLRAQLTRYYAQHASDIPLEAHTLEEAKQAVDASRFTEVTDAEEDPNAHDLSRFLVLRHPDPVYGSTDIAWFVVFERKTGKFVEAFDFN
jgi:hypothetical protein